MNKKDLLSILEAIKGQMTQIKKGFLLETPLKIILTFYFYFKEFFQPKTVRKLSFLF